MSKTKTTAPAAPSTNPLAELQALRAQAAAAVVSARARRRELEDRAAAREELDWRRAKTDIELFIRKTTPALEAVPHLRPLDEVLNLSMRKPVICLVEAPPRHGKTVRFLHHLARYLKYFPTAQVAYASYSAPFAYRKSREVRKIAARAGVWALDDGAKKKRDLAQRFDDPAAAVSFWQTQQGGSFIAGGRGGGFVGEGFHQIVIDDIFKNRAEAESPVVQDAVFEALFQGTLFTRLEPGGSLFITHQPWNDQDLIARVGELLKQQGVEHEVITLRAVKNARYDRQDRLTGGTPLWRKRFDIPRLRKIQAAVGPYNFESQYMCNRVPKGTRVFRELQRYVKPKIDHAVIAISCDPGISKNVKRDPSSYLVSSGYLNAERLVCMDILHVEEVHEEIPETVDRLELLYDTWHQGPIILEEVSAFQSISQVARRLDDERRKRNERPARLPITSWMPEGSKLIRAYPAAGAVHFGRIRVPLDAPWVEGFSRQLARFTGREGAQDGFVDCLTQLYDWYCKRLQTAGIKPRTGGQREIAAGAY